MRRAQGSNALTTVGLVVSAGRHAARPGLPAADWGRTPPPYGGLHGRTLLHNAEFFCRIRRCLRSAPQFGPWTGPPHGGDGAVVDVGAVVAESALAEGMSQVPVENLPADGVLRFGVRLPDGTKVTTEHADRSGFQAGRSSVVDARRAWFHHFGKRYHHGCCALALAAARAGSHLFVAEWPATCEGFVRVALTHSGG
jgi:hypothetical protein